MTIRIRRDTAANWTTANPVLSSGQPGYETDTGRVKIGDGVTAWNSLVYRFESASAAWGGITGTLAAQTDLNTALNGKQATLVSATNIKTINGASILGSGDLAISGGGGVSDGDKGDITVSGSGATWTIDAGAVTNAKAANMATATIKGRATAGSGDPEDLTGTQATALLDTFTSGAKGLVPPSGGGTANFLRADGTFAAPPAGGSPGGSSGEVQYNNAGAFAGAADVEIEGGQLRLPAIAIPTAPAAGGLKLFGRSVGGRLLPSSMGPYGLDSPLQPHRGLNRIAEWFPAGNGTVVFNHGFHTPVALGTATSANVAATDLYTRSRRIAYRITVAATTAVCGWRAGADQWTVGGNAAGLGGFHTILRWATDTGVTISTHRAFCGMRPTAVPTDVEPSSLLNMCGMGWDAADTNIQFMRNDGSGVATKIDLGASFPVPSVAAADVYEIAMFSPPGTTQSVSYRIRNLMTGAEATGTVTTDLPATTMFLSPNMHMSVGGTSSVIGMAINNVYIECDY